MLHVFKKVGSGIAAFHSSVAEEKNSFQGDDVQLLSSFYDLGNYVADNVFIIPENEKFSRFCFKIISNIIKPFCSCP